MNRLASETQPNGDKLEYTYDANGNKTQLKVIYANGDIRIESFTYDVLNRLLTVKDADANLATYDYDAVGNRISVIHSNANVTAYVYDELNRLTQMQDKRADETVYQQFDYTLHITGRREKITELNGRVSDYSYDTLYRLTDEVISDPVNGNYTANYTFDKVGNRVGSTINGVSTVYTYDKNDRLTQEGGEVYTYDDMGNTLSQSIDNDITTYTYDARQKLIHADILASGELRASDYRYNVDGIRIQKTDAGEVTNYLVDSNRDYAQVIAETNDANTIQVEYVFGDDLLAQKRGSTLSNYMYDGLGSTRALTDSTGNVSDEYFYDAFGVELARTGTTENDYLFTGEQYDAGLGNYYLRARYYDQGIGRFTQQDTWMGRNSDPITLHKYLYANADPVRYTDPSGKFSIIGLMKNIDTASNLYTIASVSFDLLSGNYAGAGKTIAQEVVHGKMGNLARAAKMSPRALGLFAKIWGKSVKLKLGYPANSGILRHNMTQLLGKAPVGSQAHHIVGAVSKFGKRSRDKLKELGIDLNSVSNGVFLPGCGKKGMGSIHCGKHTGEYERVVWDLLKSAKNREQAVNILGDVRKEILSGIIKLNKAS